MFKWYFLLFAIFFAGCAYRQPDLSEPYGIIQPLGGIRVLKVNGERVFDITGEYVLRVSPGKHTFLLARGHNEKTPVEGTESPYSQFPLEIEEGTCYYIEPGLKYGLNNLFFGTGFKEIVSWKPLIKKQEKISNYKK
ncbi:MAG: hypothetical protein HUU50_11570 [Candidatus Brocadiae bacterium]|nr:hypothetical protein [Candidatus Brocadiia bacterium]